MTITPGEQEYYFGLDVCELVLSGMDGFNESEDVKNFVLQDLVVFLFYFILSS